MIGLQTYIDAPPMVSFVDASGKVIIDKASMIRGQEVFHKYALMEYGSFFGDGAQRGPDFTAQALHKVQESMVDYYAREWAVNKATAPDQFVIGQLNERVKKELKVNQYDQSKDLIQMTKAQEFAYRGLQLYYQNYFNAQDVHGAHLPVKYIKTEGEINDLASFFYWGAWVCVSERPGSVYSYTHNWPYDPDSGNTPTSPVILWSVLGLLAFVLMCGIVLYYIGQYNQLPNKFFKPPVHDLFSSKGLANLNLLLLRKLHSNFSTLPSFYFLSRY